MPSPEIPTGCRTTFVFSVANPELSGALDSFSTVTDHLCSLVYANYAKSMPSSYLVDIYAFLKSGFD
jgi:hypothetical protein